MKISSESISITKAFGILLMVAAHTGCPKIMHDFIYMFHMPLFFIMSGYCFKEQYLDVPKQFLIRRVKGLYVPFVKYGLMFLVFHNVFFHLNIYNAEYGFSGSVSSLYSFWDFANHAIHIVTSMTANEQLLGGYWFLRCLFWGSLISLMTIKFVKKPVMGGGVLLLLTIVSSAMPIIRVPYFGINSLVFMSALFFMIGYMIRKNKMSMNSMYYAIVFAIITFILSRIMPTDMSQHATWQIVPYCICATMGTLMTVNVSNYIAAKGGNMKRLMVWIGNHTLTILTWHLLSFKLVSLFIISFYCLPIKQLACFPVISEYSPVWWPLYFMVGVGIPLLFTHFGTLCMNLIIRKD